MIYNIEYNGHSIETDIDALARNLKKTIANAGSTKTVHWDKIINKYRPKKKKGDKERGRDE